jgi:hypothetical protein
MVYPDILVDSPLLVPRIVPGGSVHADIASTRVVQGGHSGQRRVPADQSLPLLEDEDFLNRHGRAKSVFFRNADTVDGFALGRHPQNRSFGTVTAGG